MGLVEHCILLFQMTFPRRLHNVKYSIALNFSTYHPNTNSPETDVNCYLSLKINIEIICILTIKDGEFFLAEFLAPVTLNPDLKSATT